MKRAHVEIGGGGRWQMVLGDCLDSLAEVRVPVDALIADPPYSSGGFTRGDRSVDPSTKYRSSDSKGDEPSFAGDNRDQRSYLAWSALWLRHVSRVMRKGAPVAVWTDWRQLPITTDAIQAGGFVWRGIAVWTKDGAARPQMGRFKSDAEFLVWGSLGPMPQRQDVGVLPGTFMSPPVHASMRAHLTEKPVAVMEQAVAICPPDGLVLDPFAGSGSTGVACLRAGRRFVGIEVDEHYFALACERLRAEERGLSLADHRSGQGSIFDRIGGTT